MLQGSTLLIVFRPSLKVCTVKSIFSSCSSQMKYRELWLLYFIMFFPFSLAILAAASAVLAVTTIESPFAAMYDKLFHILYYFNCFLILM